MDIELGRAYSGKTVTLRAHVVGVERSRKGKPHARVEVELPLATAKGLTLGRVTLPAGNTTLAVRITEMPHGAAMNLKAVRLTPIPAATK